MDEEHLKYLEKSGVPKKFAMWAIAYLTSLGIDAQLEDISANFDHSLTLAENKTILKSKHPIAMSEQLAQLQTQELQAEVQNRQAQQDYIQQFQAQEREAIDKLALAQDASEGAEAGASKHSQTMKVLIQNVAGGFSPSLFVVSDEIGIGKTHTIYEAMREAQLVHGKDWVIFNGYTTPLGIYNFMFEHKDKKIIVFDDIDSAYKNSTILSFFKSATSNPTGIRKMQYNTTSKARTAPCEFQLSAGCIFIANEIPNNLMMRAMISRSLYYEIRLTYHEKANLIANFSRLNYKNTTQEQRREALTFLLDHNPQALQDFSYRTIQKLYQLMLQNPQNWKETARSILQYDEQMQAFIEAEQEPTTSGAIMRFKELTGNGERSYFRIKKKYYAKILGQPIPKSN
ncbi:MAG: hypothetical protein WC451_02695 [Patescibacteria group bacterium]